MAFSLPAMTKATLSSFNPRAELHGDDKVPAGDVGFVIKQPNTVLSEFGSQLRASIYHRAGEPVMQPDLVGGSVDDMPNLRNPMLGPLKITTEIIGATVTVAYGIDAKSNIVLEECTIGKFAATCQEGGTVILGFRVQAKPSQDSCGKLCQLIGAEVEVTVEPPAAAPELAEAA